MDIKLYDVLNDTQDNYLLPFLWMRDGHNSELPELVKQVYDSGARALCVESRPHDHFCEQQWWDDMDVVLAEAAKRDMKVWILDDKHFPTGYANGLIEKKYPEKRKWQLVEEHVDVVGPAPGSSVMLYKSGKSDDTSENYSAAGAETDQDDILLGVYAYKRNESGESLPDQAIDLTANVCGNYVFWDIPKGVYRVIALYKSRRGTSQPNYIHMIDADSVNVLVEAVYEPHYEHYKQYFGNTIAGFFSDEPSLGNTQLIRGDNPHGFYDQQLGQPGLALPWTDEVLRRMNDKLGYDVRSMLAGLWYAQGNGHPEVRLAYMDAITQLWRENFSLQLGEWCRTHGVEYIGHIIEDMNASSRLSCSGGHYFRSLDGQDMAGIDVVLNQIMPGMAHYVHAASCSTGLCDSEFFDYVLARLAGSHSHIQPRMKNRAMCEVFGAYGWAEGVTMMKNLMDHMLVRGINRFVPHAFSPDYPDPDCPPHFNAGGFNPQFDAYTKLMHYTNKAVHLMEGATEIVSAAILYHAEAEWSGKNYMLLQKPAKMLYDAQLNYDILPIDAIMDQGQVIDGALFVNGMRYPALIIPYAQYLPDDFISKLAALEKQGLNLAFINGRPDGCVCGEVVPLNEAVNYVRGIGATDVALDQEFPLLRVRHVVRGNTQLFMISNESMSDEFDGELNLPIMGDGIRLDLLLDRIQSAHACDGKLNLNLLPGQSTMLMFGDIGCKPKADFSVYIKEEILSENWNLSLKLAKVGEHFSVEKPLSKLYDVAGPEGNMGFSGWMRYEAEFTAQYGAAAIDLGRVGETAQVWINGVDLGQRICAPYIYDAYGVLKEGVNRITVLVSNTLVHLHNDRFSHFVQIAPSGLLGPVKILYR